MVGTRPGARGTLSSRRSPAGETSSMRTAGVGALRVACRLAKRQPLASADAMRSRYAAPPSVGALMRALARGRRRSPSPAARAPPSVSASSAAVATAVSAVTARSPGAALAVAPGAFPPAVSIRAWTRPRNPSASKTAAAPAAQGRPAWKPPATISTSLTKSGDGGSPARAPSEMPERRAERRLGPADAGDRVARGARLVARGAASPRRSRAPWRSACPTM